ncbi:hypothetical protein PHYPSEUDO_010874 [Phytophthora pseudosyringae]|uniref:Uncharacterized protein n=1 Tax=Phytophthora pseudosyringae TaxID=221518 RepID=A0A8T1V9C2_9STRA|nr:hypothetical protein PHYPSEUDO_010874 [Phytophthora pseudosyringae]
MPKRRKQASAASPEPVFRGWEWAHASLWSEGKKCAVRMADTIICYHDAESGRMASYLWLFTGKSGTISRKRLSKDGSLPVSKIRERFLQLSGRSSGKSVDSVAVVNFLDGTRKVAGIDEFEDILQALDGGKRGISPPGKKIEGIQAYIPSSGEESHIQVEFEASRDGGSALPDVRIERRPGYLNEKNNTSGYLQLPSSIRKEVENVTIAVVNFLSSRTAQVVGAALEFVCDSSQTLWLTHISHVELHQQEERAVGPSTLQKKSSLPNLQSAVKSDSNATKCRGEFCETPLASLPGLTRLIKMLRNQDDSNSLDGVGAADDAVVEDTGQRFKMGNNNLLLAHAELDFLKENAIISSAQLDDNALALQWQEADNVFRMELGRSNPTQFYKQVLVCFNCHRVYSELNKVRDLGFQGPQQQPFTTMTEAAQALKETEVGAGEDSNDLYDKMFLEELAKQSSAIDRKTEEHSRRATDASEKKKAPNRPELDDTSERPSSGSISARERSVLPSLQAALKPKKKPHGSSINNDGRSNQQSTVNLHFQASSDGGAAADKAASLEADLSQLKHKLAGVEARRQKLEQEILQTRTQCTAMLREKDDHARKQVLELEYSFHSKQSQVKQSTSEGTAADEITHLIETIDSLNLQLDQANRETEQAKKQLVQAQQAELKKLHEKYQLEMETLRLSEHSAKEQAESLAMQMLSVQTQASVATTQAKNAKAALEDLTKSKVLVLEETNQRLERQVAALKLQQRQQGQRSGGSVHLSASASVAKQDVEAMEKHLNHKIEYLKAQLASEMKCKEELGTHLAQIANGMEQMKIDKRQALAEQEEAFKKQSERIETAFSQEKELLATQQAASQGKLATLQANVTDLVQELTMWKSREANAKLAMEKMVEENVRVTRQLVDAEGQVEALQEERKQDAANVGSVGVMNASEETKRVQMEALLRRLDNERQYLKSQLEGQQEMKEKSQKQVTDLQYELQELKDVMEDALRASEQKISALATAKRSQEQELRGTIECLEQGKLLLNRQLKEVQTKFAEAREQSLLGRDEVDKSRIQVSEMRAQLLAAKEDSVKEQTYAKSASERMSKSLSAVKKSLKALEEEKNTQIKRLEEENAEYMGKLATTQGEMLVLEEKLENDKLRAKKEQASAMLAMVLGEKVALWRLRMQHRAFTHAKLHANLAHLQANQEQRRAQELGLLEERLRDDYMAKCDEMTQTLHDERLEAIRTMKEAHDKDREELNEFYLQEKSQVQEDLTAVHAAQMQQMKEKFETLSSSVEANAQSSIQELGEKNDTLQQRNAQLTDELAEMTQKCQVMASTFEDDLASLKSDWKSQQETWVTGQDALQAEIQAQRDHFEDKLRSETSKLVIDHARELAALQECHETDVAEHAEEFTAQRTMLSEERSQRYAEFHEAVIAAMTVKHQSEMEERISSVTQRWQNEMDCLREAQGEALRVAETEAELKANAHLASMQKEMNERKGTAVVQCTSKWQRAMEELQERQEVEKKMAYNEGLQDREKEWQQAALQIKERQREELDKVQQEAVAAIRAAEERHEMRFQAQLAELKTQLEEQHAQALQSLTDEITTRERERAQEHFDASSDVMEQELTAKWTQQLEEQQTELESKFIEEKTRLVSSLVEEKETATRQLREAHEEQREGLNRAWGEKLEELAAATDVAHEKQIESLREELDRDKEALSTQLQESFSKQLEQQLADQEARLLREQEDAIAQVQEDSEKLIEQVERAMVELKRQKEHLEAEMLALRSALEEAEDTQFDAQESFKKQQKQAALHVLHLVMSAMRKIAEEAQTHQTSRAEMETKINRLKTELSDEKSRAGELLTRIHESWSQVQTQHGEMTQTLTNYKRDELVAHRSSSAVLSNEISIVTRQLEEVEEMKGTLERDIESLQTEAQTIEASLRDLMLQSSGNNGSLNMAVVAKKRRLNEEFEALLERIEKKKAEIRTVDQTLASLRARREEKEQEMRTMERKLVEILVQQQKQMLLLVSAVREVSLPTIAG